VKKTRREGLGWGQEGEGKVKAEYRIRKEGSLDQTTGEGWQRTCDKKGKKLKRLEKGTDHRIEKGIVESKK